MLDWDGFIFSCPLPIRVLQKCFMSSFGVWLQKGIFSTAFIISPPLHHFQVPGGPTPFPRRY